MRAAQEQTVALLLAAAACQSLEQLAAAARLQTAEHPETEQARLGKVVVVVVEYPHRAHRAHRAQPVTPEQLALPVPNPMSSNGDRAKTRVSANAGTLATARLLRVSHASVRHRMPISPNAIRRLARTPRNCANQMLSFARCTATDPKMGVGDR